MCLEGGDVAEPAAHEIATQEAGASLDVLARRQVAAWLANLTSLLPVTDKRFAGLVAYAIAFCKSPTALEAARHGWCSRSLFGIDPQHGKPAAIGYLLHGLVCELSTSVIVKSTTGKVSRDVIELTAASGGVLSFDRIGNHGAPIWEHPAFNAALIAGSAA